MPDICCVYGCKNRREKGARRSFHKFPLKEPERLKLWLVKISREGFTPSIYHTVCSDHFTKDNYIRGVHPRDVEPDKNIITKFELLHEAVPSVVPSYPSYKQPKITEPRRKSKRPNNILNNTDVNTPPKKKPNTLTYSTDDHTYIALPKSYKDIQQELLITKEKLEIKKKELKTVKKQVKRRDIKLKNLLKEVQNNNLIDKKDVDLLQLNFGENTFKLIENEVNLIDQNKFGYRYEEEIKKFAITLHYYSAQAYSFLKQYLHLPHEATIRKWSASINCEPGFLTEVIQHLKEMVEEKPMLKHACLMFDAMSIKKELVYDAKSGKYAGFVDCGHFEAASGDTLAKEALVFMVVGLTGRWKLPVAYYLSDHLSGKSQAAILKQLISHLTDIGLVIHGVVCDGSYANQATATEMGCIITHEEMKHQFPHPSNPNISISFIFDACHLIKLVRNCLATLKTFVYEGKEISWKYIEQLNEIQLKDNLYLANKLKSKHIDWKQHKMNVKLAVQTLSSSVADAIDFLREDLKLPEFAGSESTTEFIRKMDKLFEFMNSKTPCGKGYKRPMNLQNLTYRTQQLLEINDYILSLKDTSGQSLTRGRRKTAWLGFSTTILSVIDICKNLLSDSTSPFKYVLTYKMSQDHLEMFFSRIRRRGGWNNNPNCMQFKWALRSVLMRNSIMPSKNANVMIEEELEESLFSVGQPSGIKPKNKEMEKFAKLLSSPSEYHDNVLYYMAGYIIRNIIKDCSCSTCIKCLKECEFLPQLPEHVQLTHRKDRGGLIYAGNDVYKIVKTTDNFVRQYFALSPFNSNKHTVLFIQNQVLASLRGQLFLNHADHFLDYDISVEEDHCSQIIKNVSCLFIKTLMYHHGKLFTDRFILHNKGSKRHKLTKTILFLGQ